LPGQSVLVVEDTDEIRELVTTVLTKAGMDVRAVASGAACMEELRRQVPDVVVLDLGLPDADGTEVCRQIRAETQCYVLMLTARAEEVDLLIGLAVGADGYMAKPFSPRELVARVRALLRRVERHPGTGEPVRVGELELDPARRTVVVAGSPVELTRTEFDLLALLAARPGVVYTREQLLAEVWGWRDGSGLRTVDSHVRGLRRKVGAERVRTVHGVGYALAT
jgi:DNA-binding response OmpR family regulator